MKIVLIGAGNVGTHLGKKLTEIGYSPIQVFSRKEAKAKRLAAVLNSDFCTNLKKINTEADLFILAVSDDAILSVVKKLAKTTAKNKLIVHTSGGTPTAPMGQFIPHYGSFYPLQTFSIDKQPNWNKIPLCIDANSLKNKKLLLKLAQKISKDVHEINDEQRAALHVSAVMVNNFTNHLFHLGKAFLEEKKVPTDLLNPLIAETFKKLEQLSPKEAQTGPAKRKDKKTIKTHLEILNNHPDYQKIYQLLTKSIQKYNS